MMRDFRLRIGVAALSLAALACAMPASAEVTRTTDNGFVTRHEVIVKATPKEVWLALISPAGWWQSAHTWSGDAKNLTLTPQAGGCFCEKIPEVNEPNRFTLQGSVEHMRVVQAYPEQALRMVGSLGPLQSEPVTGVLTIVISKGDTGTRIVLEYNVGGPMRYEVPVISKAVDGMTGAQLASLAKQLGLVAVVPAVAAPSPAPQTPAPPTAVGAGQGVELKKPAAPAVAPARTTPTPIPPPTPLVAKQPAAAAAPATATPMPAPPAQPKPAPKPPSKAPSVADVFGDLKDGPKR